MSEVGNQRLSYYRTDKEKIDVQRWGLKMVMRLAKIDVVSQPNTHTNTHTLFVDREVVPRKRHRGKTGGSPTHQDELSPVLYCNVSCDDF